MVRKDLWVIQFIDTWPCTIIRMGHELPISSLHIRESRFTNSELLPHIRVPIISFREHSTITAPNWSLLRPRYIEKQLKEKESWRNICEGYQIGRLCGGGFEYQLPPQGLIYVYRIKSERRIHLGGTKRSYFKRPVTKVLDLEMLGASKSYWTSDTLYNAFAQRAFGHCRPLGSEMNSWFNFRLIKSLACLLLIDVLWNTRHPIFLPFQQKQHNIKDTTHLLQ